MSRPVTAQAPVLTRGSPNPAVRNCAEAGVSALLLLAMWLGLVQRFGRFGFYGVFALAVTASVQLVGVYLVFSSLIIPALATRAYRGRNRHRIAYGIGALGYAIGLVLSALFDLPSGAVIVWALVACALVGSRVLGSAVGQMQ